MNCVVEVLDESSSTKDVIGTVNVTLTPDEFRAVKQGYKEIKEEEAVFDRIYCDTLTDAVEAQLNVEYGDYDFGDIVATDQNGTQFKIENPWF